MNNINVCLVNSLHISLTWIYTHGSGSINSCHCDPNKKYNDLYQLSYRAWKKWCPVLGQVDFPSRQVTFSAHWAKYQATCPPTKSVKEQTKTCPEQARFEGCLYYFQEEPGIQFFFLALSYLILSKLTHVNIKHFDILTFMFTCLQVAQHLPSHCGRTTWWCVGSVQEAYHLISWGSYIIVSL